MALGQPSEKNIAAQIAAESRIYRSGLVILGGVVLLTAIFALLMLAARINLIPTWLSNGLMTILFLTWLAYIFLRLKPGYPPPNLSLADEEYLSKTMDIQQRRRRGQLIFLLWNLLYLSFIYALIMSRKHLVGFLPALFAGALAFLALVSVLVLAYGRGNDELSRAQRAKAAQFGHILAVIELAALLIASAYRPQWALTALPWAVVMAVVLPGAYFVLQELWSGRG